MLQHEPSEAASSPATDARVTPPELAHAIATLQTRREDAAYTIALGDAVRELALDATPDELLAEVEAQRAQGSTLGPHPPTSRRRFGLVGMTAALLLLSGIVTLGTVAVTNPAPPAPRVQETFPDFQKRILVRDQSTSGPLVRTLAEVPEGRTVRAGADALYGTAMLREGCVDLGRPISQEESSLVWPVVKLGGELYVRGWVRERLSNDAARLATVEVYNTPKVPALGPHPVPVTIRLTPDMFVEGPTYDRQPGVERLFIAKLRPNKYAWVNW